MKILYLVKKDMEGAAKNIFEEHKKSHEVTNIDIRKDKDYSKIVDLIASSDRVISY